MDVKRMALAARVNAGLSVANTPLSTTRIVNNHGVSDHAPIIDLTGDDLLLPRGVYRSKQELVNDDNTSSDYKDNGIPHQKKYGHQR